MNISIRKLNEAGHGEPPDFYYDLHDDGYIFTCNCEGRIVYVTQPNIKFNMVTGKWESR